MKRFIISLISIVLLIGCATLPVIPPYTGPDHDALIPYEKISKIIAEASPTVVLRRYGLSSIDGSPIGLYKIEVGDQETIRWILFKMRHMGFDGITYQPEPDMLGFLWTKTEIKTVLKKKVFNVKDITALDLPRGLNTLSPKHIKMLEAVNVYDDYPESLSIYIWAGTTIPDAYVLMYAIKRIDDILKHNQELIDE
jgi:hypothetical protein